MDAELVVLAELLVKLFVAVLVLVELREELHALLWKVLVDDLRHLTDEITHAHVVDVHFEVLAHANLEIIGK